MSGRRARTAHTSLEDQAAAAARDAHQIARDYTQRAGGAVLRRPLPFLEAALAEALTALTAGRADVCLHVRPDRPQILHFAVHAPTELRCRRCTAEHALTMYGSEEDRTCDRCRRRGLPSVQVGLMQAGGLLVTYGLCLPCNLTVRAQESMA